jgi:hypothetical protein
LKKLIKLDVQSQDESCKLSRNIVGPYYLSKYFVEMLLDEAGYCFQRGAQNQKDRPYSSKCYHEIEPAKRKVDDFIIDHNHLVICDDFKSGAAKVDLALARLANGFLCSSTIQIFFHRLNEC